MTRDEFTVVAKQALEELATTAEEMLGRKLPREFRFCWIGQKTSATEEDVAEFLTKCCFVDETHISPSFDLFLTDLEDDARLVLMGYRACYPPCAYGDHWQYKTGGHGAGRVGPFKLGCRRFFNRMGKDAAV